MHELLIAHIERNKIKSLSFLSSDLRTYHSDWSIHRWEHAKGVLATANHLCRSWGNYNLLQKDWTESQKPIHTSMLVASYGNCEWGIYSYLPSRKISFNFFADVFAPEVLWLKNGEQIRWMVPSEANNSILPVPNNEIPSHFGGKILHHAFPHDPTSLKYIFIFSRLVSLRSSMNGRKSWRFKSYHKADLS